MTLDRDGAARAAILALAFFMAASLPALAVARPPRPLPAWRAISFAFAMRALRTWSELNKRSPGCDVIWVSGAPWQAQQRDPNRLCALFTMFGTSRAISATLLCCSITVLLQATPDALVGLLLPRRVPG